MRSAYSIVLAAYLGCWMPSVAQAEDFLGLKDTVDSARKAAMQSGDAVAISIANQLLRVLEAITNDADKLQKSVFENVTGERANLFREINNVATRIEHGESGAFIDIQTTMAGIGDTISRIPLASKEPVITFYWPAVLVPGGEKTVNVRILGTRIAKANPHLYSGKTEIPLQMPNENEIRFDVQRSQLGVSNSEPVDTNFKLTYDSTTTHRVHLFKKVHDLVKRDIALKMLPAVPGKVDLTQVVKKESWEHATTGPIVVGGSGRNATFHTGASLTPQQIQDGWVVDYAAQMNTPFVQDVGDGGSSCTGYNPGGFTTTSVAFDIQHGHNGHNPFETNATQNCDIYIAMKRQRTDKVPLPPETKKLDWLQDVDFKLDPAVDSYEVKMQLYNGQIFTVMSDQQIPYALFEISHDHSNIKIRPRTQRGF